MYSGWWHKLHVVLQAEVSMCICIRISSRGAGGGAFAPLGLACPPLDMLRILHIFYMKINDINDTINVCTKLCIMKGPKSKFRGGACPRTSLVCHRLCTRAHEYILVPLPGQKAERNFVYANNF